MILNEDSGNANYQIRAYEPGDITINDQHYTKSVIVTPNLLIDNWKPQSLQELAHEHLQPIIKLKPEVVLIGTGQHFIMPTPAQLAPLYEHQLGVESMDTGAACRTYTALMSEGRHVVAALLIY